MVAKLAALMATVFAMGKISFLCGVYKSANRENCINFMPDGPNHLFLFVLKQLL